MEYNPENLFELHDGRYITSPEISDKMRYIKSVHPETPWQDENTSYSWDEAGMADLFSECYKSDTRYCPEAKSWYTYDGGVWKQDAGALLVSRKISEFGRLMVLYCGEIQDESTRKEYLKFVSRMGDRRFRDRLLKDAASYMMINASEFDSNPYLLNCVNGTYDLKNMCFRPHRWEDLLTMQTNFIYTVMDIPRCERWEKFIDEVTEGDKEKARYIQKALGYSLLGENREECMFILHGKTTRNGKSTLLDAIQHLLGTYATVTPVELICRNNSRTRDENAASPTLAQLKGKRFVTMAESDTSGKLDEAAIKQYTGGEAVKGRELYQMPITFVPQFTMWLSCNDLPAVRDKSIFASERLKVIEFNKHFSQSEQDKTLKTLFHSEEAMPGIFTWLTVGLLNYKREGLSMSSGLRKVVAEYEKDNDLVLQFLEEKCEKIELGGTKAKYLYDAYKIWCKSGGYYVCSVKKFIAELLAHPEWCKGKSILDGVAKMNGIKLRG